VAESLRAALEQHGATVTWTSIQETTQPGQPSNYYPAQVAQALATKPDFVYVSTYFPEGIQIAKALAASGSTPPCLMGLANVDNG
jgi:ABC-type branched-subunit amino acid transport system substrate-binding protein